MQTLKQTLILPLIAGAVGAGAILAGAWSLDLLKPAPMQVAVVNLGGLIKAEAGGKEVTQDDVDAGFKHMASIGESLSSQGFLVLDASAVINAPEAFYVPHREKSEGEAEPAEEAQ